MFKKILKSNKGFTLVELLAVIVILGIIAGIAVPSIGNIIENSREEAAQSSAIQAMEAARLAIATGDVVPQATEEELLASKLDDYLEANNGTDYSGMTLHVKDNSGEIQFKIGGHITIDGKDYYLTKDYTEDYDDMDVSTTAPSTTP